MKEFGHLFMNKADFFVIVVISVLVLTVLGLAIWKESKSHDN